MSDLWETNEILRIMIEIINGLPLTQSHYVEKANKKYNHEDQKPVSTSDDPSLNNRRCKSMLVWLVIFDQI